MWQAIPTGCGATPNVPITQSAFYGRVRPGVTALRILDLMDAQDIRASFHIPDQVAEIRPDLVRNITGRQHEVAHHGRLHESPATLLPETLPPLLPTSPPT